MQSKGLRTPKATEHEQAAELPVATEPLGRPRRPSDGTVSQRFPRRLRLARRREFLRVQRSGAKYHTRFFLVFVAPTAVREPEPVGSAAPNDQLPGTRLGVTVTRKVGKAVMRNRIKRLVREAFRRERHALPAALDMVWVAKRDAAAATYEDVVHDVRTLSGRLRQTTASTTQSGQSGRRSGAKPRAGAAPRSPSPSSRSR